MVITTYLSLVDSKASSSSALMYSNFEKCKNHRRHPAFGHGQQDIQVHKAVRGITFVVWTVPSHYHGQEPVPCLTRQHLDAMNIVYSLPSLLLRFDIDIDCSSSS